MAMRSSEPEMRRPIRDLIRRLIKAPAALAVIWPVLLVVGGYVGWHKWGAEHVGANLMGVSVEDIQVSPLPAYVRDDVVQTVYRDTAMDGLSLMDRAATAKIASAFALHPWVRKVRSVRKLPGGTIDVSLEYREPVAMARIYKPHYGNDEKWYLPIDGQGVLLPTEQFVDGEASKFIMIDVPGVDSTNRPGSMFGDPRVEAAASLAEILAPAREKLGIQTILATGDSRIDRVPQLELSTVDGQRFFWGSPPGQETPTEATAVEKLQRLLSEGNQTTNLRMATPGTDSRR